MTPYFDSGVLIKLYVLESNSPNAVSSVARFPVVKLNPVQELEIRNTFRALEGRDILTAAQRAASEHVLELDIICGRLRRSVPDWSEVFRIAMNLSQDYTTETLARSLDILHVAIAICEHCDIFITADARQDSVARKAGIQAEMIE